MGKYIILSLLAYFCGSIPSGVWIGKFFKGIDIRTVGSKNSGATNAYRNLGLKCGVATLLADALKGYLPLYIASCYDVSDKFIVILGLIAIMAHSMSCFLNFKGGKGVATSLGAFLFLAPKAIIVAALGFFIVVFSTRFVSLASITGAIILPIMVMILPAKVGVNKGMLVAIAFIIAIFVIYRHRSNIKRLLNGNESKINFRKKG